MKKDKSQSSSSERKLFQEEFPDYDSFIPWMKSHEGVHFFEWFLNSTSSFIKEGQSSNEYIFFFKNESTFAFRLSEQILNIELKELWNYWKDIIKDNGYVLKNSEQLKKEKGIIFRYYLKPKLKYKVDGIQLFGNITLEYLENKDHDNFIMMKCTWYSDRNYKIPVDFRELLDLIGR